MNLLYPSANTALIHFVKKLCRVPVVLTEVIGLILVSSTKSKKIIAWSCHFICLISSLIGVNGEYVTIFILIGPCGRIKESSEKEKTKNVNY